MEPSSPRLILASESPRRQSLLREAGYTFIVHPSNIDELAASPIPGQHPSDLAARLAATKAQTVADEYFHDVVLAADTIVVFGDQILGKPADADHARAMLGLLEATTHLVITAVAVVRLETKHLATARVTSAVCMRPLSREQIDRYVATNAWRGKAGGYGIQDNDPFVERLTGCLTNIVGLPMTTTVRMLREAGVEKQL